MSIHRRQIAAAYDEDASIDRLLASSAEDAQIAILRDLAKHAIRARRQGLALSVLIVRIEADPAAAASVVGPSFSNTLNRVFNRLRSAIRETDILGRLNDRELLAILVGADDAGAEVAADRLRGSIGRLIKDNKMRPVAIGVTTLRPSDADAVEIASRASMLARPAAETEDASAAQLAGQV